MTASRLSEEKLPEQKILFDALTQEQINFWLHVRGSTKESWEQLSETDQKNMLDKFSKKMFVVNDPKLELVPSAQFPIEISEIVLGYLDGKISVDALSKEEINRHTLFGKTIENIRHSLVIKVAELFLQGKKESVKEALDLVREHPDLVNYSVTAKDPKGRRAQGKLLEIILMGGDINVQKEILKEKNKGAAERLIAEARILPEEVKEQLDNVIFSEKAQQANKARKQRVLTAVKKFIDDLVIIKNQNEDDLPALESKNEGHTIQSCIAQFDKDLNLILDSNEVITSGCIFDPSIICDALDELAESDFGDDHSNKYADAFYINLIGKLQNLLSARDAQAVDHGISHVVNGEIPPRTFTVIKGSPLFFTPGSPLGDRLYVSDIGAGDGSDYSSDTEFSQKTWEQYVRAKEEQYKTLSNVPTTQLRASGP